MTNIQVEAPHGSDFVNCASPRHQRVVDRLEVGAKLLADLNAQRELLFGEPTPFTRAYRAKFKLDSLFGIEVQTHGAANFQHNRALDQNLRQVKYRRLSFHWSLSMNATNATDIYCGILLLLCIAGICLLWCFFCGLACRFSELRFDIDPNGAPTVAKKVEPRKADTTINVDA